MAVDSKKTKVKSKKNALQNKTSELTASAHLKQYGRAKKQNALKHAATTRMLVKNTPGWLKARPEAIRMWHQEDKKKKRYRSFRLQKRIKPEPKYIPSSFELSKQTLKFLLKNRWLFGGIIFVHACAYIFLLYSTTTSVDVGSLQDIVNQAFGNTESIARTATLLGAVVSTQRIEEASRPFAAILTVVTSLVYIWAARERTNGVKITVRDAYYQSLAPVISVFGLLFIISLQMIPFGVTSYFYASARANSLFANGFEDLSFFLIMVFSALISLYFITSSVIALCITTIPGVYPIKALRAAAELVKFRRLAIFKRILAVPLVGLVVYLLTLLLILRFIPELAFLFIDVFTIFAVPIASIYIYKLYRSLL